MRIVVEQGCGFGGDLDGIGRDSRSYGRERGWGANLMLISPLRCASKSHRQLLVLTRGFQWS